MTKLKSLFAKSRGEILKGLKAELKKAPVEAGLKRPKRLKIRSREWVITLDTYSSDEAPDKIITRLRAPYVNPENFKFSISPSGPKNNGETSRTDGESMSSGEPDLAGNYSIDTNNEVRIKDFLQVSSIKTYLLKNPGIKLEIAADQGWFLASFPRGVDELRLNRVGAIRNLDELVELYEFFAESINQLCIMGTAYKNEL